MKFIGLFGSLLISLFSVSQAAATNVSEVYCQNGNVLQTIVSIKNDIVKFEAGDGETKLKNFTGDLVSFDLGENLLIEAKTKGIDAWRFLNITIDTLNHTVKVEQQELEQVSEQYTCESIRLAFAKPAKK